MYRRNHGLAGLVACGVRPVVDVLPLRVFLWSTGSPLVSSLCGYDSFNLFIFSRCFFVLVRIAQCVLIATRGRVPLAVCTPVSFIIAEVSPLDAFGNRVAKELERRDRAALLSTRLPLTRSHVTASIVRSVES